ncbi:Uncharacterised protein [Segatella copri]|nr:Uncharacterised protein [Segatella copri]
MYQLGLDVMAVKKSQHNDSLLIGLREDADGFVLLAGRCIGFF